MWQRAAAAAAVRAAVPAWLARTAASGYGRAAIRRSGRRPAVAAAHGIWRGLRTTAAPPRATAEQAADDGEAEVPLLPPDFNSTDPFRVLGVPPGATVAQIKRAYYRLALQYHPDAVQRRAAATGAAVEADAATMERRFHAIGDAYRKALQRTDVTARSGLTADVANVRHRANSRSTTGAAANAEGCITALGGGGGQALRRNWDEQLLGPKVVESSRRFFKWFLRVVGENYDTLIHDHLEKVPREGSVTAVVREGQLLTIREWLGWWVCRLAARPGGSHGHVPPHAGGRRAADARHLRDAHPWLHAQHDAGLVV